MLKWYLMGASFDRVAKYPLMIERYRNGANGYCMGHGIVPRGYFYNRVLDNANHK